MSDVQTPVVETPVVAPVAPQTPEPTTIASHEAQYGKNGTGTPTPDDDAPLDDVVDEDTSHSRGRGSRAKSKQAAARINKLAAQNYELTQRLAAIEAKQTAPSADAPKSTPSPYTLPSTPALLPHTAEPTIEQFADKDDPYGSWQRALAKWDRQQEALQAMQSQQQQQFQQTAKESEAYWAGVRETHQQRLAEAVKANPQAAQALQSVSVQPPPLLDLSIMLDNDSAATALFLATHPVVLDEFVLMTAAQPVTEQTVAITRRLLRQRMSAGTTGSVAPSSPLPTAPRPPNPVRTGPMKQTDAPPGDDSSLKDHERYYGKGKHRD